MNIKEIEQLAKAELEAEKHREAVERAKDRLRNRATFWKRLFPFKIIIVRR